MCDDLWILVQGEERGGVTWDTLKVVLLNLIGIRVHSREKKNVEDAKEEHREGEEAAENPTTESIYKIGFFEEDVFYLKTGGH